MLLFGKNKRSVQCVHTWIPADLEVNYEYNGVSEDREVYIVLICNKCNESKRVDEYTFQKMKRLGFILG